MKYVNVDARAAVIKRTNTNSQLCIIAFMYMHQRYAPYYRLCKKKTKPTTPFVRRARANARLHNKTETTAHMCQANNRDEEIAQTQNEYMPPKQHSHTVTIPIVRRSVFNTFLQKQHKLTFYQPASSGRWPLLLLDCRPSCCCCCWLRRFVVVETGR